MLIFELIYSTCDVRSGGCCLPAAKCEGGGERELELPLPPPPPPPLSTTLLLRLSPSLSPAALSFSSFIWGPIQHFKQHENETKVPMILRMILSFYHILKEFFKLFKVD